MDLKEWDSMVGCRKVDIPGCPGYPWLSWRIAAIPDIPGCFRISMDLKEWD